MENRVKSVASSWDKVWDAQTEKLHNYKLAQEENSVRWQHITEIIKKTFGSFENVRSVEIGAGSGKLSTLFARNGAHVTLMDYSEQALDFSRKMFRAQGIDEQRTVFQNADALKMDPKWFDSFDVSMSFGVVEHVTGRDRYTMFKTHIDLLKPGGVTIISEPNPRCIPFKLYEILMKPFRRDVIEYYLYTKDEFGKLAHEANIQKFSFFGSSVLEAYNPYSFYKRKKDLVEDISAIKKEKPCFLDKYQGRGITFVGYK
jgi:2-polyprenyl-3-methyl-5-hydroxy-6-metoxy-1,4-benzoquinol methylase